MAAAVGFKNKLAWRLAHHTNTIATYGTTLSSLLHLLSSHPSVTLLATAITTVTVPVGMQLEREAGAQLLVRGQVGQVLVLKGPKAGRVARVSAVLIQLDPLPTLTYEHSQVRRSSCISCSNGPVAIHGLSW